MTATKIKVTAIQTPSPDNTVMVARQLKESVEVGQRLRGDPNDSFVRVSELTQGGLWKLVNGVLVPGTIGNSSASIVVADSITGAGTVASPAQLSGDSAAPGNTMLYGTNGSGTKGWYAQPAGGSTTLAGLTDVAVSSPADGQVLTYSSGAAKWGNQSLASVMLADTPLGFWKCDDASASLADSSGGAFNLTTVNGTVNYQFSPVVNSVPSALANIGGLAGAFAANGWQATTGLGASLPLTNWTLELTFYLYSIGNNARLFDFRTSGSALVLDLLVLSAGQLQLYWNTGASPVFTGPTLAAGVRYHAILTCSSAAGTSTLSLYINGNFVATGTASSSTASGGTPVVTIGGSSSVGSTVPLNLGYVALFASVLSKARIAAHAAAAGV